MELRAANNVPGGRAAQPPPWLRRRRTANSAQVKNAVICGLYLPAAPRHPKMKLVLFAGFLALPLAASAQRLVATLPPITYHVGLTKAPLYSSADTLHRPNLLLPSQSEVVVVGRFSPRWVVVKREGFLYLAPINKLSDYDPADASPLPIDPVSQLITYQEVVQVPGASQADLYARATAWAARTYSPPDQVTPHPATGEVTIEGQRVATLRTTYAEVPRGSYAGVVRHTLTIYVKDGRYKYVLTNLTHDATGVPSLRSGGALEQDHASLFGYAGIGSRQPWEELKVGATRDVRHLLADLQAALTLQPVQPLVPTAPVRKAPKAASDF